MTNVVTNHVDEYVRRGTEAMSRLDPSSPMVPRARLMLHLLAQAHGTTTMILNAIPTDAPAHPEMYTYAALGEAVRVEEMLAAVIEEIVDRSNEAKNP